ncbi:tetratricopeptide repeat protein [Cellvibrio sp. pealriver]|uniref:tetratricopeptide repeat protein n=1 Tax=Cellvibrio sp. pealriver TaxID=1622269 RepID=UPI00066FE599|nr:tetratricopeptide repeat protein [Cellvibrio sp. pealriver]
MNISIIQLTIAYTFTAVIVFTAVITALSLIGKVRFADQSQQKTLFRVLIIELVAIGVGLFSGIIKFDANAVRKEIVATEFNARKNVFDEKLAEAKQLYSAGKLTEAYTLVNDLFRSDELEEYFPIKDLFVLNGDISKSRKFWLEAIESYGPALKLDPSNVEIMVSAGYAQRELQNYEEAETLYERALVAQGQNWEVLNGYFNCLRRYAAFLADEYPKIADEKFQKAATISQQMANVATDERTQRLSDVAKATLYWEWKKYDVASATYKQLIRKYPNQVRFKEDLAAVLVEMENFSEAKEMYLALYKAEINAGTVSWFVGAGYAEAASKANSSSTELQQALDAGLAAIAAKPDEPFSYYAVGLVYKSLGNDAAAIKYLSDAEALEARRDTNIHTYDKTRHELYKSLIEKWRV